MSAGARLAGIAEDVALEEASVYHAVARAAALEAFARAYEEGDTPAAAALDDEPEHVMASWAEGELLVIAGAWRSTGRTCGRLVAPSELLALLLDDPRTTAVWCDEEDGEGLALTAYSISVADRPLWLIAARSARAVGERRGVTEVVYGGARLDEGEWTAEALDAFLLAHDGDAVVLPPAALADLARDMSEPDDR